jgi:hypothetical protein
LQSGGARLTYEGVSRKEEVDLPQVLRAWTRPDAYIAGLARRRTYRRSHGEKRRTQPESPRAMLSTLPFLVLLGFLGVLAVGIMIIAFPGSQPKLRSQQPAAREQGRAERGWFQEAQKEMHH